MKRAIVLLALSLLLVLFACCVVEQARRVWGDTLFVGVLSASGYAMPLLGLWNLVVAIRSRRACLRSFRDLAGHIRRIENDWELEQCFSIEALAIRQEVPPDTEPGLRMPPGHVSATTGLTSSEGRQTERW